MGARRKRGLIGAAAMALAIALISLTGVVGRAPEESDSRAKAPTAPEDETGQGAADEPRALVELCRDAVGSGATARVASQDGDLPQVASQLISDYEAEGDALVYGGYLDLLGNVWGCCVRGDGWVDVAVVSEVEGKRCEVEVVRFDGERFASLLA